MSGDRTGFTKEAQQAGPENRTGLNDPRVGAQRACTATDFTFWHAVAYRSMPVVVGWGTTEMATQCIWRLPWHNSSPTDSSFETGMLKFRTADAISVGDVRRATESRPTQGQSTTSGATGRNRRPTESGHSVCVEPSADRIGSQCVRVESSADRVESSADRAAAARCLKVARADGAPLCPHPISRVPSARAAGGSPDRARCGPIRLADRSVCPPGHPWPDSVGRRF
jgi:hypothetical protein